jgi:hypothetical protein
MQLSVELRWFWDERPAEVADWFRRRDPEAGGGNDRRDCYFRQDDRTDLGIKIRGGQQGEGTEIEIKGLIAAPPDLVGEMWGKWRSPSIPDGKSVVLVKRRWLRKLSLDGPAVEIALDANEKPVGAAERPEIGCNVELTRIEAEGQDGQWWSLGFEAFGSLASAPGALVRALDHLRPPALNGRLMNYPQFLATLPRPPG